MKFPLLFSLLLLVGSPLAGAKQIRTETTLADLGVLRPERLTGTSAQKDFFLPLPSRLFDADASRIQVQVQPAPFVSPGSIVSILVNDRPVDSVRVGKGGPLTLRGPIPRGTRADDPTRNILKLTVKTNLALAANAISGEAAMDRAAAWVDVLPASAFTCAFDNAREDWISIGRLAITLRPQVEIIAPTGASPVQTDLALKLSSWVARNAPRSELFFSDARPNEKFAAPDRFVVEPATPGDAPLEITTEDGTRIVHVRAGTAAEADGIWRALQIAEKIPLPGNRWTDATIAPPAASPGRAVFLRDLDRGALALVKGAGDTSGTFHFDLAELTRTPADLRLNLRGTGSSTAERTAAIFLNDRLVFSAPIPAGARDFDFQVPLPAARLRGSNAVSVAMMPTADTGAPYFWQLDPESFLQVGQAAEPADAQSLLDASARFAAGPDYQVWLAKPTDWRMAAYAVAWLQRVNPVPLLTPVLADKLAGTIPAIVVGSLAAAPPAGLTDFPVSVKEGRLSIRSSADASTLSLSPAASLGIWQLGKLAGRAPALLVDEWGPEGDFALAFVSAQMAASIWIEGGDVVIGDVSSPILTFATREAPLPSVSELPALLLAEQPVSAPGPAASAPRATANSPVGMSADWAPYRWWIIGGLWLVLSAIIIWIFEQGRRRASH